jgi:bifunctional non-homologous end joining protein LigD
VTPTAPTVSAGYTTANLSWPQDTDNARNGFTPASRTKLFEKLKPLETKECPFANLPEKSGGRWGAGLTARKMADCRWLKPVLVGQFEFVE